jgi:hypothetical protein
MEQTVDDPCVAFPFAALDDVNSLGLVIFAGTSAQATAVATTNSAQAPVASSVTRADLEIV